MVVLHSSIEKQQSTQVTDVQQTNNSYTLGSSENGIDTLSTEYTAMGTQMMKTTFITDNFPSTNTSDHIDDVDKKSINVMCNGKCKEFYIFPLEKISVLLHDACDWNGKRTQNMKLVFKGEYLDVMKTVSEYPSLRGGSKVNLIHA